VILPSYGINIGAKKHQDYWDYLRILRAAFNNLVVLGREAVNKASIFIRIGKTSVGGN